MKFLYFAYGSNMLSQRLIARCPSAKVVGTAVAPGHVLEFAKQGIDGSGKATLVAERESARTPGVLFEIATKERETLDRFETAGIGYDRIDDFAVATADGTIRATTYIAREPQPDLAPFDWYLALVIAGALEHDLPAAHVATLRKVAFNSDHEPQREARQAARDALARSGHDEWPTILE